MLPLLSYERAPWPLGMKMEICVFFFLLFFSSIHAFVLMGLRRPAGSLWVKDIVSGLSFHPPSRTTNEILK